MRSLIVSNICSHRLLTKTTAIICFFLLPFFCVAAIRHVPSEHATIQGAIDAASDGDEIIVSPGTYYENITFNSKNIILRSTDPADRGIVNTTVIDGRSSSSVVMFSGAELSTCVLSGFTITHGRATKGGGVYGKGTAATLEYNVIADSYVSGSTAYGGGICDCDGVIRKNVISDNSAHGVQISLPPVIIYIIESRIYGDGGGLYGCDGTIEENIIRENSADFGGGLYACNAIIKNNLIDRNSATGQVIRHERVPWAGWVTYYDYCGAGGGIAGSGGIVKGNIIWGNSANYAGGGLTVCNGAIHNNTIYRNSASDKGGGLSDCRGTIRNCIIQANSALVGTELDNSSTPSYSCIGGWTGGGTGNISAYACFVDPLNGDFHLLPSSPCIDGGCYIEGLTKDFEGDPRPINGSLEARGDGSDFDIGADEFVGAVPLRRYDFELTEQGWAAGTIPGCTQPNCYYLAGQIILTAQDNTKTFGYWTSEADAVPVIADCLYRASWTVATDVSDPLAVPQLRLRVNSQNLQQADMLVVGGTGDGSYAPTLDGRTYEMYFIPPESCLGKPEDQDDLILSFDIFNFDPIDAANGSLLLDQAVVEVIPFDTLSTATVLKRWDFDANAEGWQYGSASIFFTEPLHDNISGALWLIAQNNTNTFGFWSSPTEEVKVEADKLYHVRFIVSSDAVAKQWAPGLRLRVHSEDFQAGFIKLISSVNGAEMSPSPEGHAYHLYFYPPQSLVGTDADGIILAFDIMNFDPTDAPTGALMLHSVLVESLNLP